MSPASFAIDRYLTCAFALHSSPGAFAVLLGAGASIAAGVPSAWGVQEELIRRIAAQKGEQADNPASWYEQEFGMPPTYDDLLAALTTTQAERQALLRGFFEPTEDEKAAGSKLPTTAHKALARLVAAGRVRIILTTNFDRLSEQALTEVGIEPTVVSEPAQVAGLNPLHTQRCLVVHLHGDYLNPAGMLNTADELGNYPAELDTLLDKVFSEYGLVILGWSATWDTALRNVISRNPNRFFATYWVDPYPLSQRAKDLLNLRQAQHSETDADTFLGQVADACDALDSTDKRHPLTAALAVATAKRGLAGETTAIPLHDTIRFELDRLRDLDVLDPVNANGGTHGDMDSRIARLDVALEVPLALVAATAYWGDHETDRWWFDDITRFATSPHVGGTVGYIHLIQAPATYLLYAAGIAATAARRHDLIARLLREPATTDNYSKDISVAIRLTPSFALSRFRGHRHIHEQLRAPIAQLLGLGDAAYNDASEQFEYLRLTHTTYVTMPIESRKEAASSLAEYRALESELGRHTVGSKEQAEAASKLETAKDDYAEILKRQASQIHIGVPHMWAVDRNGPYVPAKVLPLVAEISREAANHPLIENGFCDHDAEGASHVMRVIDLAFDKFADEATWSTLTPVMPHSFYPDEHGKWLLPQWS